jgi:hypothetical protein
MGSSPSSERNIDAQEAYVKNEFSNAKTYFSQIKYENLPKYNDVQIKMKLRQDYYNHSNNKFIMNYDWEKYKKYNNKNRKL